MAITPQQKLEAASIAIKPLDQLAITIPFFNGEKYKAEDGLEYPGYSPVVIGTISENPEDENYISPEKWEAWVNDAYYDIDAFVNKAMTVLGVFHSKPNFTGIPVITKDHLARAIAAKVEQNLFTNPSNAEIRTTLTQSSGGRTTNLPARENFNPSDLLNQKVQEYINGSNVVDVLTDSFEAIILDRNDYYTKEQIDAIIQNGRVPVEALYTLDVEGWEPTEDGDGVNKKYVDYNINDLQEQINALLVGDVELKTNHIALVSQPLESYTGLAVHQQGVNTENKIVLKQLRSQYNELSKRTGVPLQAYKTLAQTILSSTFVDIVDYDEVGKGTQDSLAGMDVATGEYTISEASSGDQVSFSVSMKVTGTVKPNVIVGYATLFINGAEAIHPVTGLSLQAPITINTIAGASVSINAKDINIREGVDGEWNIGDKIKVVVKQTAAEVLANNEILVSDVHFDMANNRVLAEQGIGTSTDVVSVTNQETESLGGTSSIQSEINAENKVAIETLNNNKVNIKTSGVETPGFDKPYFGVRELPDNDRILFYMTYAGDTSPANASTSIPGLYLDDTAGKTTLRMTNRNGDQVKLAKEIESENDIRSSVLENLGNKVQISAKVNDIEDVSPNTPKEVGLRVETIEYPADSGTYRAQMALFEYGIDGVYSKYQPTSNYSPTTKEYVDNAIQSAITDTFFTETTLFEGNSTTATLSESYKNFRYLKCTMNVLSVNYEATVFVNDVTTDIDTSTSSVGQYKFSAVNDVELKTQLSNAYFTKIIGIGKP